MSYCIHIDEVGRVLHVNSLAGPIAEVPGYDPDFFKYAADDPGDPNRIYWHGGLKRMPERPSEFHDFDYAVQAWAPNNDRAWLVIRARRDSLLSSTDWVRLRAADLGEPVPQEWLAYRQALRDITDQPDPLNIVWPEPPTV